MVSLYMMQVYTCMGIYHLGSESIVKAIEIRIKNYRNTTIEGNNRGNSGQSAPCITFSIFLVIRSLKHR